MRRRIYLDCDGVLADFDRGAEAILGLAPHAFEQAHGAGEFWRRLARAPEFFANLDPLPDAMQLYEAVRAQGYGRKGTHALMLALEHVSNVKR